MSHIPFAITAYILNGVAILVDKFMLTNYFPDPLVYIFYFSIYSLIVLFLIPFLPTPTLTTFLLSSSYMISWLVGSYLMFKGLQKGLASRVVPIIGALVPIFLIFYYGYLRQQIPPVEKSAGIVLTAGLLILIIPNLKGKIKIQELSLEILSALSFSFAYILLRQAYRDAPFLVVFAWSKLILIPIGLSLFIYPKTRRIILTQKNGSKWSLLSSAGALFISGQIAGGASELLITFSISLANPALVNSLQGIQYIFLFIASIILGKSYPKVYSEQHHFSQIFLKLIGILVVGCGLFILAAAMSVRI